ncbi:aldo/keto reductase [bacterium]|nr:aldo/keto reductase [bacterium]
MKDITIPEFLYGTAWKEDKTCDLVLRALKAGFRGIDTACQRKHYYEAGVGKSLKIAYEEGLVSRNDLFLQTKYTYIMGQDQRLPYNPDASYTEQVRQSFMKSLENLCTEKIDSYILHGPAQLKVISDIDIEVWREMEAIKNEGLTQHIGVSNIQIKQLEQLFETARIKPAFVQNRCYAKFKWDSDVRAFCKKNNIIYQGFSLLTANKSEISTQAFVNICEKYGKTPAQIIFRFAKQLGMLPLTGTTNEEHMKSDLDIYNFELNSDAMHLIENISTQT